MSEVQTSLQSKCLPKLATATKLRCRLHCRAGHRAVSLKIRRRQNFTTSGRKRPTSKTKTVLKSVNKMEQLVGMPKSKREQIQNKNRPNAMGIG